MNDTEERTEAMRETSLFAQRPEKAMVKIRYMSRHFSDSVD
jgi:hypothetical protein